MGKSIIPQLKKIIKVFIPLILGIAILYFLYKGTDFREMWSHITGANWTILTFSLIFGLAGNVTRGLRWELLVNPLAYYPKRSNMIYAVLGSYAVNFVLPRVGEFWRCGVIHKQEKVPFQKLIGTLIIDRAFDAIMVIIFALIAFSCNVSVFFRNIDKFDLPGFLTSPYPYLSVAALILLSILAIIFMKNNLIVKKIRAFLIGMWSDMLKVWRMRQKTRFIVYSFLIWIFYFLYFYITLYAFDFTSHLGLAAGLFVFTLSSISMGIPSNGGLGPWQAATVFGLCIYMVSFQEAKAFATAVFAFQSIWVVLCGLFGIFALSFSKNSKQ